MSPNLSSKHPASSLSNPRVACGVTLTLVFLCGAVVGALAMNLGVHKGLHRAAFWTDAGKSLYLERLRKDLDLTPSQVEQMSTLLDDFNTYYRSVLSDGRQRIMQILNDNQRHKFEQILQQRKSE